MAQSTQANRDGIESADAHAQGLDGGLNLKTDSSRLAPPATTRSDNAWYLQPGNVQQLPAPSSVMQANTNHIYNVHARDLQQPATTGDVMVHGEVLDSAGSSVNRFTTPCWSDGNGATLNTQQPCVPVSQRSRILSGKTAVAGYTSATSYTTGTGQYNTLIARQESGYSSSAPQRYAVGYHNGTTLNMTFGLVDGMIETPETLTLTCSADYCEVAGVQGTNYWICAAISGATLTVYTYDFKGVLVAASQSVSTQALQYNNVSTGYYAPLNILQHAGRTFVAYINNPSGSADSVYLWDVITKATVTIGVGSTGSPNNGFAIASPYSHSVPSSTLFLTCLYNNAVYVVAQASVLATGTLVGTSATLGIAATTGYSSAVGSINYTATMSCCIFAGGGTGTAASLGVTVFRHYPELITRTNDSSKFWYQSVSVDRISFQANATTATSTGTIASLGQNVFRTPSGAQLCSKAFDLFPSAAGGAGLSAAKNAYCLVRCGAVEPFLSYAQNGDTLGAYWTYGQPTYFIIDHQARVVGRAFENVAPPDGNYPLANQGAYFGSGNANNYVAVGLSYQCVALSQPLVLALNNDVSALDIIMPAWVQGYANAQLNSNNIPFLPANVVMEIGCIAWSVSAQGASVPPLQAGPYTVVSGALTCVHDGRGVVEANYHFAAQNPQVAVTTNTSNSTGAAGTYYWSVVFDWIDSLGRVHRSAPSTPMPGVVSTGNFLRSAVVNVPLPMTVKTAVGGVLNARLYRSVLNQTDKIFYLVSTQTVSALSNTYWATLSDGGGYVDVTGVTSGGSPLLTTQPRLYVNNINGNQTFASQPPPAFIWQCAAKGRAFGIAQNSQTSRLYYSSQIQDGFPFEWNSSNYAPVPTDIGDVRSIEALDDKIVLFGTRSVAVMNGDGPPGYYAAATTGSATATPTPNDGFSLIGPVPTPVGCIGPGAPARTPDGLLFQGYSGIQLMGRDLSIQAVGAAVDAYTGRQVGNPGVILGRGVTLASLQSVVFTNAQGPAVVYNYLTQRWSLWPLLANATSLTQRLDGTVTAALQPISNGQYASLANASAVGCDVVQLGTAYSPIYQGNQSGAALVLESPWILPSGESGGEAALWDVTVTGGYVGPHILQIEQTFNYVPAYQAPIQFKVSSAPSIYQYRVRPRATSRIWAARYRITILPLTTLGSGYFMATLGDLVLNYGAKQGTSRLSAAASG